MIAHNKNSQYQKIIQAENVKRDIKKYIIYISA